MPTSASNVTLTTSPAAWTPKYKFLTILVRTGDALSANILPYPNTTNTAAVAATTATNASPHTHSAARRCSALNASSTNSCR